jgi:purine-binding chemotaxis protein CheW
MQTLIFNVGGEELGIPVDQVREVLKLPEVHQFPSGPDGFSGIISVRNHGILVIDLAKRFGLTSEKKDKMSHVIIVRVLDMILGLIVDSVSELVDFKDATIDSAEKLGKGYLSRGFIKGVVHVDDRLLFLLDLSHLFDANEVAEIKEIKKT